MTGYFSPNAIFTVSTALFKSEQQIKSILTPLNLSPTLLAC